jgi:hypothetical protein
MKRRIHRRDALKSTAGTLAAAELVRVVAADASPVIEAYAGQLSYQAGDTVELHVSSDAARYSVEIARIGARRQVVFTRDNIAGTKHPVPADAVSHGCRWPAEVRVPVAPSWRSGYYQVLLRSADAMGEAFFVVRARQPDAQTRILIQLCTNTYNAYNTWGGASLYTGRPGPARRVSFERPYAGFVTGDRFTSRYSGWHNWEKPFVEWTENAGYRLDYAINADLEARPEILNRYRLVLSVGHDEYWSAPMRDHLEAFIRRGGNVAFFSGNTCFWQVRSEDRGRALVSWKAHFHQDPVHATDDHRLLTGMWSNALVRRPENELTGVSFAYGGYHRFFEFGGEGCYVVHRPQHWVFDGTNLRQGDRLGQTDGIVGYECDGCQFVLQDGLPVPTHRDGTPRSFQILATAPAWLSSRDRSLNFVSEGLYGRGTKRRVPQPGAAVLGAYTAGGTVFTTGCTEWVRGLEGRDATVERITRNVLDRLSRPA